MSYTPPRESPPPLPLSNGSSPHSQPRGHFSGAGRPDYDNDIENGFTENTSSRKFVVENFQGGNFGNGNTALENSHGSRAGFSEDEQDVVNRLEMDDEMMVNNDDDEDDEVNNHHRRYADDDDDDDDDGDLGVRSGPRGGILVRGGDVAMGIAAGGYRGPSRPTNLSGSTDMGHMGGAISGGYRNSLDIVPPVESMSNIPLSSPDHTTGGEAMRCHSTSASSTSSSHPPPMHAVTSPQSKLDTLRNWSFNTYKFTRQILSEKLGRVSRTVDTELESQIELLRDTQLKYNNILRLTNTLAQHFSQMAQTQRALGDVFSDLSQKNPELREEFSYNAETQRVLYRNGDTLLAALQFFTSTMNTLCNKTMDDTLLTIKQYEAARVEYDAYRVDLESWGASPLSAGAPRDPEGAMRYEEARSRFESHKEKFERLRSDVTVKIKFLDENRVKVMHKQLLLLHNAIASYFSGNQTALAETLKQFNIKLKTPNSERPSWLETHSPS